MDRNLKNQGGFSLAELLTVLLVVSILVALGGAFSPKSAYRRSVDSLATQVANNLQLAKLSAARDGVEYRTIFEETGMMLTMITHRGDSNTDSTIWTTIQERTVNIKVDPSVVISNLPDEVSFEPVGQSEGPGSGCIPCECDGDFVILAAGGTRIDRCGFVRVSELGRIGVIQGHWNGTCCEQVSDKEP